MSKEIIEICAWCDDKEEIEQILVQKHGPEVLKRISHSICDKCKEKVMETINNL